MAGWDIADCFNYHFYENSDADGKLRYISPHEEPELFKAVIGGYGLLGVIIEVELETIPNSNLKLHSKFISPENFQETFEQYISTRPQVELAYGRLSITQNTLFKEIGLFWYEKEPESANRVTKSIQAETLIAFKRAIFRISQYIDFGKKIRWFVEKFYYSKLVNLNAISRNNVMNTDIHLLWPLYGQKKDILQEYFIPKNTAPKFLAALKKHIINFDMNILNITIREIRKDNISLLPYTREDMFGLVCLFSQNQSLSDETKMVRFTQSMIDDTLKLNGTFYLPYRLHYRQDQILKAYPSLLNWIKVKEKWDKNQLFDS